MDATLTAILKRMFLLDTTLAQAEARIQELEAEAELVRAENQALLEHVQRERRVQAKLAADPSIPQDQDPAA